MPSFLPLDDLPGLSTCLPSVLSLVGKKQALLGEDHVIDLATEEHPISWP